MRHYLFPINAGELLLQIFCLCDAQSLNLLISTQGGDAPGFKSDSNFQGC